MPDRSRKPPRDPNAAAKRLVDAVTGGAPSDRPKNAAAVALGRLGGLKGGRARASSLSAKQRSASAKKAAKARWAKG